MTLSLRARLAGISGGLFGVLLVGLSVASYVILARTLDADATERLADLTEGLHGYLHFEQEAVSLRFNPADDDQATFVHEAARYYQVYDATSGLLLAQSPALAPLGVEFTPDEVHVFVAAPRPIDLSTAIGRLRIANDVAAFPDGRRYLLQVGVSLVPVDQVLEHYRSLLLWRVPPALLVAVLASWWLSGFALAPLAMVAAATRDIDVGALDRRLPVRGAGDELDRVTTAFNETLVRLQRAVDDMRQFSTALAHELRTPLASLRGSIELNLLRRGGTAADQAALASQLDDIDRLTRLIDRVLTLARAEAGQLRLTMAPVDISALAAALVEQLEPVAEARSITLASEGPNGLVVQGDKGWLQQMLINLLDNAIKYTGPGGQVVVRVYRDAGLARIDVRDTGVGLSAEDARHVFDRFFRADPARSSDAEGTGLGLSLVQWIATQHHGSVTVASRLGEGSTFTVTLPV